MRIIVFFILFIDKALTQKFPNFYEWFKERWFLRGEKPFLNTQYVALAKKKVLSPL